MGRHGAALAVLAALLLVGPVAACGSPADTEPGSPANPGNASAAQSGTGSQSSGPSRTGAASPATPPRKEVGRDPAAGSAEAALARVPVKGRAPKTGYDREEYGTSWTDDNNVPFGHNGCDTRNDVLRRDLYHLLVKEGTFGCVALSGDLKDPYTATSVDFDRGTSTSTEVQIDHVVALGDSWQSGAQQWSQEKRQDFANDPLNLLAVDGPLNMQKGDGDAATWLPPNRRFRCDYVARQVEVKRRYAAWVTRAEHDAIARVLARCPGQTLPRAGRVRLPSGAIRPGAMAPAPVPHPPSRERSPPGSGRVFRNCAAVRAAGLAPLRRGTKDYAANPGFDRDQDGLACER